jgi:enoyl-[acyl-carrier-protein] reductase (NADH)
MHPEGAELAFTYPSGNIRERVENLAPGFDPTLIFP